MRAKARGDRVVARRQQLAVACACRPVAAQLDLVLGVPAGVVADHRDIGKPVADCGVDLRAMKTEGAVAEHRHHARSRQRELRRRGKGQRRADRPGRTVDHAMRREERRLGPLAELAAVGDQNGIGRIEQLLHRARELYRMQRSLRLRAQRRPLGGPVRKHGADFIEPAAFFSFQFFQNGKKIDTHVDLDDPAGRGERGAELEREIALLAGERHHVGALQHLGDESQARIVHAARAFHDDRGHAARLLEFSQPRAAARVAERRPGDQQGGYRLLQTLQKRVNFSRIRLRLLRKKSFRKRKVGLCRTLQKIDRKRKVHRAGAPGARDAKSVREVHAERLRRAHGPGGFRRRRRHRALVHFLERAPAELRSRRMPGEKDHRRFGGERRVERTDRVRVSRAASDEGDPRLAGEAAPSVGHVHRGRLVTHVHDRQRGVERRIEHRHDVVAREREEMPHAGARQRFCDQIGAACRHY